MKRRFIPAIFLGAILVLGAHVAMAQTPITNCLPQKDGSCKIIGVVPLGYVQMVSPAAATPLPSIPAKADLAVIRCTGQQVRYRDDNVAPTIGTGMTLNVGDTLPYAGILSQMQIIQTASSAVCDILYYQ